MSESAGKLLLVDDEASIRKALGTTLAALGFCVEEAETGEEAISLVLERPFEVVLLDVNMPGIGGIAACRELRRLSPSLSILMLTVRDGQEDRVNALDSGADDYIAKPFQVRELTARVRAAVRRARAMPVRPGGVLRIGDIELDESSGTVRKSGLPVRLTPKEFELLRYLMQNAGTPITHTKLLNAVWGPEYGGELEYLRTFVRQLRIKLEEDPSNPVYLMTRPYVGYWFADGVSETRDTAKLNKV